MLSENAVDQVLDTLQHTQTRWQVTTVFKETLKELCVGREEIQRLANAYETGYKTAIADVRRTLGHKP